MDPGQGAGVHPLALLPEDVWPLVAGKLEDSADILNLIQVVPGLEAWMEWKKRFWLFEQVIPHVARFLKRNELLACRQVCKKWSLGVDNFLDNHPILRPYSHGKPVTGQIWPYGGRLTRFTRIRPDFPIRPLQLESLQMTRTFLQKMEGHDRRRSPIVNKALYIQVVDRTGEIWDARMDLLRSCGEHVWYFSFCDFFLYADPRVQSRLLVELLGHLPNLKSLSFDWNWTDDEDDEDDDEAMEEWMSEEEEDLEEPEQNPEAGFAVAAIPPVPQSPDEVLTELFQFPPPLPHLETLVFQHSCLSGPLELALVSSYSHQLRRLEISAHCLPDYPTSFPNLTELTFQYMTGWDKSNQFLHVLDAPLLSALEVPLNFSHELTAASTSIFPWLRRYPLLRNLSLSGLVDLAGGGAISPTKESCFPSLKYISIPKNFLWANSDFLLCFPNLEVLHLPWIPPLTEEAPWEPSLKIWEHIEARTIYESNVWELMRKLKRVIVKEQDPWNGTDIHFTRETHEYRKKMVAVAEA